MDVGLIRTSSKEALGINGHISKLPQVLLISQKLFSVKKGQHCAQSEDP
jgi:hypothetical protein